MDFTELIDLVGEKLGGAVKATCMRGAKVYEQGQFAANAVGTLLTK